jgi:DNA polymerase III sliding clamp (beta) subunit (PCNA family)
MDRNEFIAALDKIKPGLSKNALVEESEMVLFERDRMFSYNDEVAISCPFETGLSGAIRAKELYQLLQRLKKDVIKTKKKEDQFTFVCGNTKAGFKMIEDMKPPSTLAEVSKIESWNRLPANFAEALKFCMFSASTNIGMGILTCLRSEGKEMLSCDNFRATQYRMETPLAKNVVLYIPRAAAGSLVEHGPQKVHVSGSWIHFKNKEDMTFSCRTLNAEHWPEGIKGIFKGKGKKIPFPEGIKEIVLRAETLTDSTVDVTEKLIDFKIDKGFIICRGEGPAGWVEEKVKIDYDGERIEFKANANFFSQILDQTQEAKINERVLMFQGKNFTHVISRPVE